MASANLHKELECAICLNVFTDPVMLRCGHNFCLVCINGVLDTQGGPRGYSCPACREEFEERPALHKNIALRNIKETFLSVQPGQETAEVLCTNCVDFPLPAVKYCLHCEVSLCDKHLSVHKNSPEHVLCDPTSSPESRKCSVHRRILEYYCSKDAVCICASCIVGDHQGHQVKTLDEAYLRKKEKLINDLQKLRTERDQTEKRVQSMQEFRRKQQEQAEIETKKVNALFNDLRKQLDDLEKRILKEISRLEEEVSDVIQMLEIQQDKLSKKMLQIEELYNLTDPLTFLQEPETEELEGAEGREITDIGGLDVIGIGHTIKAGLTAIIRAVITRVCVPRAAHISLDVTTAYNFLKISDDRKTVSWSDIRLNRPQTPGRFQRDPQVLSSNSFSSGRQYWEVDVGKSYSWAIGMCYPSIDRGSLIGQNNKYWGLVKSGEKYLVIHQGIRTQLPDYISINRVRIYVNYEAGQLSFYNLANQIQHLHTFTTTFTEPLHAALYVGHGHITVGLPLGAARSSI